MFNYREHVMLCGNLDVAVSGAYHPGASISHVDPMSQRIYTLGYF